MSVKDRGARCPDWDTLPPYLQDAIDRLLVEDAKAEALPPRPLRELLSETGETP